MIDMAPSTLLITTTVLVGLTQAFPAPHLLGVDVLRNAPTVESRPLALRDAVAQVSTVAAEIPRANFGTIGRTTIVEPGVTYWLSGGGIQTFYGNIVNYGQLFVTQTSCPLNEGQTSDWVGHDLDNGNLQNAQGALIQLNDIGSATGPTYDWNIHSMDNNGTIQWCGKGDNGGSTYHMFSDLDATNNGLISFEQSASNDGAAFVWRNLNLRTSKHVSSANLYNNGAVRLINVVFHNVQNVFGTGCWQIGKGGVLYLEDGTGVYQSLDGMSGPSFPNQTISFMDPSAVLHMDTAVYSHDANFGPQIYGFTSGNAIEFCETIQNFTYDATDGVLTVRMLFNSVNIKIGAGYNATGFFKAQNPQAYNLGGYNAIFYNGSAPNRSLPASCTIDAPLCQNLTNGLPSKPSGSATPTNSLTMNVSPAGSAPSAGSTDLSDSGISSSMTPITWRVENGSTSCQVLYAATEAPSTFTRPNTLALTTSTSVKNNGVYPVVSTSPQTGSVGGSSNGVSFITAFTTITSVLTTDVTISGSPTETCVTIVTTISAIETIIVQSNVSDSSITDSDSSNLNIHTSSNRLSASVAGDYPHATPSSTSAPRTTSEATSQGSSSSGTASDTANGVAASGSPSSTSESGLPSRSPGRTVSATSSPSHPSLGGPSGVPFRNSTIGSIDRSSSASPVIMSSTSTYSTEASPASSSSTSMSTSIVAPTTMSSKTANSSTSSPSNNWAGISTTKSSSISIPRSSNGSPVWMSTSSTDMMQFTSSSSASTPTSRVTSNTTNSTTGGSAVTSSIARTSSSSSAPASSSSIVESGSPTSTFDRSTTSSTQKSTAQPSTTSPYTPYYPALATSYTTNPALTGTISSDQACATQPEAGTYCGFINPEDPCAPQPDGYGPIPTPDTASAFLAFPPLHAAASAAPSVISSSDGDYLQTYRDLNASSSGPSYLSLVNLQSYDAEECASLCDADSLCNAFNIYAERDPSLNPSANDSTAPTVWGYWCPNPPSMTSFKCTLWGTADLDASTATNTGQWRENFQVVVTASNAYDRTNSSSITA